MINPFNVDLQPMFSHPNTTIDKEIYQGNTWQNGKINLLQQINLGKYSYKQYLF